MIDAAKLYATGAVFGMFGSVERAEDETSERSTSLYWFEDSSSFYLAIV
jgi:hypothetical protein